MPEKCNFIKKMILECKKKKNYCKILIKIKDKCEKGGKVYQGV